MCAIPSSLVDTDVTFLCRWPVKNSAWPFQGAIRRALNGMQGGPQIALKLWREDEYWTSAYRTCLTALKPCIYRLSCPGFGLLITLASETCVVSRFYQSVFRISDINSTNLFISYGRQFRLDKHFFLDAYVAPPLLGWQNSASWEKHKQ
jgi:hypothetical protein